jgi:hypothetical protein
LADGGLGDTVDLGGLGEAFGFRQVAEHLYTFDLHCRIKSNNPVLVKYATEH